MTLDDPLAGYFYDFVSIEALLKGLNKFDDPEILTLLKERCNIDLNFPKHQYPAKDIYELLGLLHQTLFPELSEREALLKMGRATARGFSKTVLGQIMSAPLKVLTPDRAVQQMVKMFNGSMKFGKRVLLKQGEQDYVLQFLDDPGDPAFTEGIINSFLHGFNLPQVKIQARRIDRHAFEIRFNW